ncbi:hypothetical protein COLO4_35301 [Corchorus olitorius]|uniref:Uncharacterized protein n=1 Tax=Corchorus olitorius TaxID=93759 RepID=A0A1R3GHH1_9ROSI|nr:hypothetical protein COLO4_35301 [Corchorus olitorius]
MEGTRVDDPYGGRLFSPKSKPLKKFSRLLIGPPAPSPIENH